MYSEDALLPISALQHLLFCERQCALIHVEQQWEENIYTAEGRILHEKCDSETREVRGNICIARSLAMRSLHLGLAGKADVVEFHKVNENTGIALPGLNGKWLPVPIEYKRGKPKIGLEDKVQLCAQAMCLEEMLLVHIPLGYIYYGSMKRRYDVTFDQSLREQTENAANKLHELINMNHTPIAIYEKNKCDRCSLIDICMPRISCGNENVNAWLENHLKEIS